MLAVHPDGHNGSQNMHVHIVINSVRKYEERKENNNIQHKYYSAELDRPDWNREYIEYGRTIFRKNVYKFFQLVFEDWSNRDS